MNIKEAIQSQIDNIDSALRWVYDHKRQDYRTQFMELMEQRRILKKIKEANDENPALAAFGVSQVGKSYLMGCILKKDGKPFILKGKKRDYNFLKEMNPLTKNTEATGVVTRFTSFLRNPSRYSAEFPIMMRCLSLAQVATIISDGYYNDIKNYKAWQQSELLPKCAALLEKYEQMPVQRTPRLTPDEVLEMKVYFRKHLNNAQALYENPFFDNLAYVVDRIPESDLPGVLALLWHNFAPLTRLLEKLINTLCKLEFSPYIYLPEEALVHESDNENTLMSVECLNQLFSQTPKYFTDAYIRKEDTFYKVDRLTKSEVGALCREIIVKIGEEYLDNSATYNLSSIKDSYIRDKIRGEREVKKDPVTGDDIVMVPMSILRENDLLDFPGARGRENYSLDDFEVTAKNKALMDIYLRGKVAYLFNVYNESWLINVLFYCHHSDQHDVTDLPDLIRNWIMTYVGDTMEERRKTIARTGISPFFYIATKFNMDMERSAIGADSPDDIRGRWRQRFKKVLQDKCFKVDLALDSDKVQFYNNWTKPGEKFSNSYLLRDFTFSSIPGSGLFSKEKTPDHKCLLDATFYKDLRETFINSDNVQQFFSQPELSWDAAATIDNDGATLILDRLIVVASRMDKARTEKFEDELAKCLEKVYASMKRYEVNTDIDKILETNIRAARLIFREMSFTCNNDNYYFGHLLQALQLKESETYTIIHKTINNPEKIGKPNDFRDYEIIITDLKNNGFVIEELGTDENKWWNALMATYGFDTREEGKTFLENKKVNFKKLLGRSYRRKKHAYVIADEVYNFWTARIKSAELLNDMTGNDDFDMSVMNTLTEMLVRTSEWLNLSDRMAKAIDKYVSSIDIYSVKESFLADVMSSIVNKFVLDLGYSLLSDTQVNNARKLCKEHHLPAFKYIERKRPEISTLDQMSALFDDMTLNPKSLLPSFEDRYNSWVEYMFISFVANLNVPKDFNKEANTALQKLLRHIMNKPLNGPEKTVADDNITENTEKKSE